MVIIVEKNSFSILYMRKQGDLHQICFIYLIADSVSGQFRPGDSVRLRMDESLLTSEFLLSDLNHYSIGFIHQVDDDGDVSTEIYVFYKFVF